MDFFGQEIKMENVNKFGDKEIDMKRENHLIGQGESDFYFGALNSGMNNFSGSGVSTVKKGS
jgi:hypothetical protein